MQITSIIVTETQDIIHLIGLLNIFEIFKFNIIPLSVSKFYGVLWFLAFILFTITVILYLTRSNYWWFSSFLAIIISQILIINYWPDAKLATIVNIIILLATVIGFSSFLFKHKIKEERINLFKNSQLKNKDIITKNKLVNLPLAVQIWLTKSGIIGRKNISNTHLVQELQLKMTPKQTNWSKGTAEQYFTVYPPAFNWNINTKINSMLSVVGRDKFEDGKSEMIVKLFSLIPIVKIKNNKKINQATLQRYLAEIIWFPSASLSQHIKWEAINNYSARATMEYKGTRGSGEFYFDKNGKFEKFTAMRYQDSNNTKPTEWIVTATKTKEINGINIPMECEASWVLDSGKWTWLKLKIKHIEYNVKKCSN